MSERLTRKHENFGRNEFREPPSKVHLIKEALDNPKILAGANTLVTIISAYGIMDNLQSGNGYNAAYWSLVGLMNAGLAIYRIRRSQ